MPENSGKLWVSCIYIYIYSHAEKTSQSREFQEIHSADPERALWDDFPWWMRVAKADMLGTGEVLMRGNNGSFLCLNFQDFEGGSAPSGQSALPRPLITLGEIMSGSQSRKEGK